MLGWHISVYRQQNGGASPASFEASHGTRLAVWQAGLHGLDWIEELVTHKRALSLGGHGYPLEFTAMTRHLKAQLIDGPPGARERWIFELGDILSEGWAGKTLRDLEALHSCQPDEWLLIQAWDES
jgi:hypothetical protein